MCVYIYIYLYTKSLIFWVYKRKKCISKSTWFRAELFYLLNPCIYIYIYRFWWFSITYFIWWSMKFNSFNYFLLTCSSKKVVSMVSLAYWNILSVDFMYIYRFSVIFRYEFLNMIFSIYIYICIYIYIYYMFTCTHISF